MKRKIVDEEAKKKMKEMEEQGASRKEIAYALDLDPSTVTKHLGSVRPYNHHRQKL